MLPSMRARVRERFDHGHTTSMGWSAVAPCNWDKNETPRAVELSKPIHKKTAEVLVNADPSCRGPMFGSRRQINLHRQNLDVHHHRYQREYLELRKIEKQQHEAQETTSPRQQYVSPRMPRTQKRADAPTVIRIPKTKTYSPGFSGSILDRGWKQKDWQ